MSAVEEVPLALATEDVAPPPTPTTPTTAEQPKPNKTAPIDYEPPAASVQRIVKAALPENCQITKESKTAFTKAAGIFIIYLTSCANDFCLENKRSTITSADIVAALKELDFHELSAPLEDFLALYRKDSTSKKEVAKQQQQPSEADADTGAVVTTDVD